MPMAARATHSCQLHLRCVVSLLAAITPTAGDCQVKLHGPPLATAPGEQLGNLGDVTDVTMDVHRVIYLLDGAKPGLIAVDTNLRFLKSFGRVGSGPGEFREPIAVAPLQGGGVAVLDRALRRISTFRWAGHDILKFDRALALVTPAESMCLLPDGKFLIYGHEGGKRLHVYSATGRLLRSFGDSDARMSPMANTMLSQGRIACDPARGAVIVTSKFLPRVEAFNIQSGIRIWSDTLIPFRQLVIKDDGKRVSIASGRAGASLIARVVAWGGYDLIQTRYDSRVDRATVDTIVSFTRVEASHSWSQARVDLPILYRLSQGLALTLETKDEDIAVSLFRLGGPN